jgi:hypothetical protein
MSLFTNSPSLVLICLWQTVSLWDWKITPTDTALTVRILTCTYKGQTVPLVNRSEKSSSNKSLWKELNLQIAKHAALWSQFWQLREYRLLSFPKTQIGAWVLALQRKTSMWCCRQTSTGMPFRICPLIFIS